ncbi:MAG: hypothetical protein H6841_05470 [Planctomycetes bacterium]|nr:hypothetical protein [Planctomycetota bacterium]MCB9935063.1 hypothetical protein [Planctomycetota bacterium]
MKAQFAILAALGGLVGCASEPEPRPERVSYDSGSRFVQATPERPAEQSNTPLPGAEFQPVLNEPITVDFVDKFPLRGFNPVPGLEPMPFGGSMFGPWDVGGAGPDDPASSRRERFLRSTDLHTALHYIALRTGLQVIVDGKIDAELRAAFRVPSNRAEAIELIQSICKANKLDYIQDGDVIILKARPEEPSLANVITGDWAGVYHVKFEEQDLVTAIMEVAVVTKSQVLVPTSGTDKTQESQGGGIKQVRVTLELKNATAEEVLRKLAELGDMDLAVEKDEGGQPFYRFSFKE